MPTKWLPISNSCPSALPMGKRVSRAACVLGPPLLILIVLVLLGAPTPTYAQVVTDSGSSPQVAAPSGSYAVGHLLLDWEDSARYELATRDPGDRRVLTAEIWYPAELGSGRTAAYLTRLDAYAAEWDDETVEFLRAVEVPWHDGAVVADGKFPILLFSHGWSSRAASYSTFLANVASHGYVVLGIDHPYLGRVAMADGSVTEPTEDHFKEQRETEDFYAADVMFILDRLTDLDETGAFENALALDRIAAAGHSSGFGSVMSGAAALDPRIKALISFDSGVGRAAREIGLAQPLLLFRADSASYTDLFFRGPKVHPRGTIYDVDFFRRYSGSFYDLVVPGTTHGSVFDGYLWAEDAEDRSSQLRALDVFGTYAVAFLDATLKGEPTQLLRATEAGEERAVTLRVIRPLDDADERDVP